MESWKFTRVKEDLSNIIGKGKCQIPTGPQKEDFHTKGNDTTKKFFGENKVP